MESPSMELVPYWITRLQLGDPEARSRLIANAFEHLDRWTRRMLKDFPRVQRWEETSEVRQAALLRLNRALEQTQPATVRDFLRLAACEIRRELIDLARHDQGPQGLDTNHDRAGHLAGSAPGGDSISALQVA